MKQQYGKQSIHLLSCYFKIHLERMYFWNHTVSSYLQTQSIEFKNHFEKPIEFKNYDQSSFGGKNKKSFDLIGNF